MRMIFGEAGKQSDQGEIANSVYIYPYGKHNQRGQAGDVDESINPCDRRPQ